MKTLVIYAHPKTKGHNEFILQELKKRLKQKRKDFEIIDLYKIKYDPVLYEGEHYTAGNKKISEQNKKFQDKIRNTSKLIFVYPVWWGSMPAILKGFLDRILTPGFAFKYSRKKLIKTLPYKLLKGKKAVTLITSGGPKIGYFLFGNSAKIAIKCFTLEFSGIKTRIYQFFNCKKLTEDKKIEIKKKVEKSLIWLYK